MTAVLLGKHSLDRTPDGLVTAFVGDLSDDMVTRIMPVIGAEAVSTDRFWLSWFDEAAPKFDDDLAEPGVPEAWSPMLDAVEVFDKADADRADEVEHAEAEAEPVDEDAERAAAARVAVGRNYVSPLTYDQLGEVLAALKRLGE